MNKIHIRLQYISYQDIADGKYAVYSRYCVACQEIGQEPVPELLFLDILRNGCSW